MDLAESLTSSQRHLCSRDIPMPANDLPLTPPSTETSTPYQTLTHCPPQHSDLEYVTHRLWSGSQQQQHTRRFSFENPTWPDEEGYWLDVPLLRCHTHDDDATIVSNSSRTQSPCSQKTLCESFDLDEQSYTAPQKSPWVFAARPQLPHYSYDKALPPTPPTDRLDFSSSLRLHLPTRSRKCSLAGSSISSPICATPRSSALRSPSSHEPCRSDDELMQSFPTFEDPREAPKPPVVEKSGWDSDSEDEERTNIRRGIRRRFSEPFRAFLCSGKEPRRKSA